MYNLVRRRTTRLPVSPSWRGRFVPLCTMLLAIGAMAAACSSTGPARGAAPQSRGDSIYVHLDNNNFYDASVYLNFAGGTRRRLAVIPAYTEQVIAVRWDAGEFWFVVDFIGARTETRTRRMAVNPGDSIELQLTANSHRTGQLIVRRR